VVSGLAYDSGSERWASYSDAAPEPRKKGRRKRKPSGSYFVMLSKLGDSIETFGPLLDRLYAGI